MMKSKINSLLIIILMAVGITIGLFVSKYIHKSKSERNPVFSKFEQIQYLERLHLVTYHFEEIIPIEKKNDKIALMLIVPARVYGYINMEKTKFELSDSTIRVILPPASIDSAIFDIDKAINYDLEKKFGISAGSGLYDRVFEELKKGIKESRRDVTQKSIQNGILDETTKLGKEYIRSFLSDLGYYVEFTDTVSE
ncbi:MAG: DUF4230 domain-containing protein [Bacteroidales bacterium]|nr:DUF4230 domain-containing protein [Bacteroidales bacterium]